MLKIFQKNYTQITAPISTTAIDENTARIKARDYAKSYLQKKLDPCSIRFYAIVG